MKSLSSLFIGAIASAALLILVNDASADQSQLTASIDGSASPLSMRVENGGPSTSTSGYGLLAPGHSVSTYSNVVNVGDAPLRKIAVAIEHSGGKIITDAHGLEVTVEACTTAWADGECAGGSVALVPTVPVRAWSGNEVLDLDPVAAGDTLYFRMTTTMPVEAGIDLSGEGSSVSYAFTALQ